MTNLTITEIRNNKVAFSSSLGAGEAMWVGETPRIGGCYSVEFDVDDFFEWNKNIKNIKKGIPSINVIDNNILFTAKFITYESDGVLTLSLGSGILFLETSPPQEINDYVSFFTCVDNFFLYPLKL